MTDVLFQWQKEDRFCPIPAAEEILFVVDAQARAQVGCAPVARSVANPRAPSTV